MPQGLLFFLCGCCILLLTTINLAIGPVTSGKVGDSIYGNWGTLNCKAFRDLYDDRKKEGKAKDDMKYEEQWAIDCCDRKKGMYNMEYTAFIFDIVIGFVCGLLGLLHYFELKKTFVEISGLIGLICGIVGFILTLVYVILNGLVYTLYYEEGNPIYKRDKDGVFAELEGEKYKCLYFDKEKNVHSSYAKYSDLIKKQYNYNYDLMKKLGSITDCRADPSYCEGIEFYPETLATSYKLQNCKKLYLDAPSYQETTIENKDISDRFLTALILSLIVCLANIGLAIFGFLMAKSGDF